MFPSQNFHPLEILVHQGLSLLMVEFLSTRRHYLTETLEIFGHVGNRPFLFLIDKLLDAFVHDALLEDVKPVQLTNELDVSEHVMLRYRSLFFLVGIERSDLGVERLQLPVPILKLILEFGDQQTTESVGS